MSKHFSYRPDIDGLRAIAVLAVVFFHAKLGVSGGYVGVDIFFVISGYLITGLIYSDIEKGRFHLLEFWARRVRRILPALSVVVITCLVVSWFMLLPIDYSNLARSAISQAVLVSNIYFRDQSNYFGQPASRMPLLHTWSLSVEEQFYLFFPLSLVAIRALSRRGIGTSVLVLAIASFGLSVYFSYAHPWSNFYLLPTRAWELLIGACLTILAPHHDQPRWQRESASWIGLLAILAAVFFYNDGTRFPGASALLPCGGAALIIWGNTGQRTSVGHVLASAPLVFVGLISYSLYLWHWPVLVFAKYWSYLPASPAENLALICASAVLATLSWRFVETPFRKRMVFKTQVQILSFGVTTIAALIVAGFVIDRAQGFPARFPAQAVAYAEGSNDTGLRPETSLDQADKGELFELGSRDKGTPAKLLVWGDSHAMATLSILNVLCKEHGFRAIAATHASTLPLLGFRGNNTWSFGGDHRGPPSTEIVRFNNAVIKYEQANHLGNVLLVGVWGDSVVGASDLRPFLLETIRQLKEAGARVWIMRDVPRPEWDVPRALAYSVIFHPQGSGDFVIPPTYYDHDRLLQDQLFQGIPSSDATILDPTDKFLNSKHEMIVEADGKCLYFDGAHLSTVGAARLRPVFEPMLSSLATPPQIDSSPQILRR